MSDTLKNRNFVRRTSILVVKFAAAGMLLWVLFRLGTIETRDLVGVFREPVVPVAAGLLILAGILIGALRWHWLLKVQGINLPLFEVARFTGIAAFSNNFLLGATGGDAVRIICIVRALGTGRTRAVFTVLVDRLCGFLGLVVVLAIAAIPVREKIAAQTEIAVLTLVVFLLGVGATIALVTAWWLAERILLRDRLRTWQYQRGLRGYVWQMLAAIAAYRRAPLVLLRCLGLAIVIHGLSLVAVTVLARVLYADALSAWDYAFATPLSLLANLLPLTPGGIGLGEGAFDQICRWLQDRPMVVAYGTAFLAFRAVAALATVPGLFAYLAYRNRKCIVGTEAILEDVAAAVEK